MTTMISSASPTNDVKNEESEQIGCSSEQLEANDDVEIVDTSVHLACWMLSCPFVHFGSCPYKTGMVDVLDYILQESDSNN